MRKDHCLVCSCHTILFYVLILFVIVCGLRKNKTPQVGIEPTTYRLTADRSTAELLGISSFSK
jgi:hypothetical protein